MNTYYVLVEEWLYTTESGRDTIDVTFDSREEALLYAGDFIKNEVQNFSDHNKVDCLPPEEYSPCCNDEGGFIITPRNGLDEWYYAVRVFKINPLHV